MTNEHPINSLDHEDIIITLSGKQSPGALTDVMKVLGTDPTTKLVDFGQLVVRDRFTATAMISTPATQDAVKDILFRAHASNISVHFDVSSAVSKSSSSSNRKSKSIITHSSSSSLSSFAYGNHNEYVLTIFSPDTIDSSFLSRALQILSDFSANILNIDRLTEQIDPFMCLEIRLLVDDPQNLRQQLFNLGHQYTNCDLALQRANITRKAKRMAVFDLSWTLVEADTIDILLSAAKKQVDIKIREKWERKEISRVEWLKERIILLKGLSADDINKKASEQLQYTNGAIELCKGLKRLGFKLAIVSSGSKDISDDAKEYLGLDYAFGNVIEIDSAGKFTGTVRDPIIDAERKAELVQMLAMQERIDIEQIIAIGDGPVSSEMLSSAGMSIAFDQQDATNDVRSGRISSKSLASVLFLLGIGGNDFRRVTRMR